MSKKASIAMAALTAIAATSDVYVIAGLATVAITAIISQCWLDSKNGK